MKECNRGTIPPCYGSLEFAIYEEAKKANDEWKKSRALHGKLIDKMRAKLMEGGFLDDTHDKVYELNKQMCDLERGLSNDFSDMQVRIADKLAKDVVEGVRTPDWAKNMLAGIPEQLSRAEYEILDEILKEKNRPMKEKKTKKTKKMTKAEAFEYLKHKKVAVTGDTITLQNKLFNIGYKWCDGSIVAMPMIDFLLIDDETFQFTESLSHFRNCGYAEISSDDILSIEIVDEKKCSEEDGLDLISTVGARLSDVLRRMEGHKHIVITEDDVILYDEGMCLFHSDPF